MKKLYEDQIKGLQDQIQVEKDKNKHQEVKANRQLQTQLSDMKDEEDTLRIQLNKQMQVWNYQMKANIAIILSFPEKYLNLKPIVSPCNRNGYLYYF